LATFTIPLLAAAAPSELMSWDEAHAKAAPIVAQMTMQEKAGMMLGIGWTSGTLDKWWYVGNTASVPRLGVPTLNMQDAAGGFRTYWTPLVGTVTCWPSLLAMAATFDTDVVHQFAVALGDEFAGKGANTILGPSINVHRVARNGRNFEYLSGEDPYLGARLTEQYVHGVQSRGVMAVMKHWVFNSQETHRNSESSVVDEKTAWELYYPPFEAAVKAGVSAVMCSYNRVDGRFSCENDPTLNDALKTQMGFQGFIQSDWGATHSTAAASAGLDMEMPMTRDVESEPYFFDEAKLKALPPAVVDEAVGRTLAAMIRIGLLYNVSAAAAQPEAAVKAPLVESRALDGCTSLGGDTYASGQHVGCCTGLDEQLIQIEGHPAQQYVCVAPPGKCEPPAQDCLMTNVTSAAHAALARASAAASIVLLQNEGAVLPLLSASGSARNGVGSIAIVGAVANGSAFDPTSDQGHGSWNTGDYYSGGGSGHVTAGRLVTPLAGLSQRAAAASLTVIGAPTDNVAAAVDAAKSADVAIVLAGTTCGEADDRTSLSLDNNADALIAAVAATGKPTVVLMQVPGATLTPWRRNVSSVAALFLGGQETGSAWADVIFGDVVPTGKLPLVFPQSEDDTIPPSPDATVTYTEGLATSYRNAAIHPAFPFGHGLSYTDFSFALVGEPKACAAEPGHLCVDATVTNTGDVAAATVAQLYVGFPPEAGQPAPLLKGFVKTRSLAPSAAQTVTFELTERDLSFYDVASKAWVKVDHVDVSVGTSSADIRDRRSRIATARA